MITEGYYCIRQLLTHLQEMWKRYLYKYYCLNQHKTLVNIRTCCCTVCSYSLIYTILRDADLLVTGYAGMTCI